jgi:rubrerythrin
VPVLRGDQLVGIVSRSDLIRQIAMRWVCPVCGEVLRGPEAPEQCPRCHAPKSAFTHEVMQPGM